MAHPDFLASVDALASALRRYARAAVGNADEADACVARALETVLSSPPAGLPDRTIAYRALYQTLGRNPALGNPLGGRAGDAEPVSDSIRALAAPLRHAFLLARLEKLSPDEIAAVMSLSTAEVRRCLDAANRELRERLLGSVLIVEDNFLVAEHLASVLETFGHDITAVARTADDAIAAAQRRRPAVVLADVELGSSKSGIDAVAAIRERGRVPTVYVTAYPERVLAAPHTDSALVVTKPFEDGRLREAVAAALMSGSWGAAGGRPA
jgi:CheY-like chemotaxis protein